MADAVRFFELVGVTILVVGSAIAFVRYGQHLARGVARLVAFTSLRAQLGRSILLGLEVLVVADIVRTIVVEPTLESAMTLGVIVLVRVLLSFAIDIEVDGVVPWHKRDRSTTSPDPTPARSPELPHALRRGSLAGISAGSSRCAGSASRYELVLGRAVDGPRSAIFHL